MSFYRRKERKLMAGIPMVIPAPSVKISEWQAKDVWFSPAGKPAFDALSWWRSFDGTRAFILLGYFISTERRALRCELRELGKNSPIVVDYWAFVKYVSEDLYLPYQN
jgi:hypothetical protein